VDKSDEEKAKSESLHLLRLNGSNANIEGGDAKTEAIKEEDM
jgi:hypothetical protein